MFLIKEGWKVKAIGRSNSAMKTIQDCGGEAFKGDLSDVNVMIEAMKDCSIVFHCAAFAKLWGTYKEAHEINTIGTQNVIEACKKSKNILKLIYISTEQVLSHKTTLLNNVNENTPYPKNILGVYGQTKKEAEIEILKAGENKNNHFQCMIIRPRWIWGKNDSNILPIIIEKNNQGMLKWFDNGNYLTSTVHVDNVCYALLLIAKNGQANNIYFVTDGEPVKFRNFISNMIICSGNKPPTSNISFNCLWCLAGCFECCCSCSAYCQCCSCCIPPINQAELAGMGRNLTIDDNKIRKELGYKSIITMEEGFLQIADFYHIDRNTVKNQLL